MKNKRLMTFKNKKWFTLIEMLIVIVIIGILAAAIIPRLNSARGRANDVARKADLNQVATALITYQIDNSRFPSSGTTIDQISNELIAWGMTSIPKDPANTDIFSGVKVDASATNKWYYSYTPIKKNWISNWWFVLMSKMESHGQANYVFCDNYNTTEYIDSNSDYNDIDLCSSLEQDVTTCSNNGEGICKFKNLWELRYIYKY